MTQTEVERLLGGPPGDYGRNWEYAFASLEECLSPDNAIREETWANDHTRLEIFFDGTTVSFRSTSGRVMRGQA